MNKNDIIIIHGTDYKEMAKKVMDRADVASEIGDKNKKIALKPNLVVARESSSGGADITSSEYTIGSNITGVDLKTSVSTFKSNVTVPSGYTMKILDSDGREVTSGNVGTGMRAVLYSGSTAAKSHTIVIKGDVSGDGNCSSVDVLFAKRYIVGTYDLTGAYFSGADINGDGKITSVDALFLSRHVIGTYTITN